MRFKLPDDAGQGWPVVVNLGLLHPTLPAGIIKELKDCVKRLVRIIHNIGKPYALIIFEEHLTGDCHAWQIGLRFINVTLVIQAKFEPTKFAVPHIVPIISEKASAILFRKPLYWQKIGETAVRDNFFFERILKDLSARYDR